MFIQEIVIKDSPTFKHLNLAFHPGLNVISGASGAGKSVFFASLLALFGIKDSNATMIEGRLDGEIELFEYLSEEELVVQILKKEKTRFLINHQSTSRKRLGEIFAPHVKFLSHKNSNELSSGFLLELLDALVEDGSHREYLGEFRQGFAELQRCQAELWRLKEDSQRIMELQEFALFEIEKIAGIAPKLGEYEELLEVKKRLSKKEKLQELGRDALMALQDLGKVNAFLSAAEIEIEGFDEMLLEVDSRVCSELERLDELDEYEPEQLLDRLSRLSDLISRYGGIEEALEYQKSQQEKLLGYEHIQEDQEILGKKIEDLQARLDVLSVKISSNRKQFVANLASQITHYASMLLLGDVHLNLRGTEMQHNGKDELEILLGTSAVSTLSSGEYNRLRLATLALQNASNAGILLLDEIDANLSGEESEGVAKVLKKLASSYQVFAISHQPHLPALADAHFVVQKDLQESLMRELDLDGRIHEIARMISGSTLTKEALEFARKKMEIV
ncbi:AAA family ATPase [Helicobacter pametensis]|uniref:AAA family ATPase n=1 Tax=Helicobacter pametensis TaxID=95149 RepID=UPI0004AF48BF|nr:AAA family ATPase [Helicobacter pametensis]